MTSSKTLNLSFVALSAVALLLGSAVAQAEDFTGPSIGVHADYLWGHTLPSGFGDAGTKPLHAYDTGTGGFGADLRYDWQSNDMVYGIFASGSLVKAQGSTTSTKTSTTGTPPDETTTTTNHGYTTELTDLVSAGARIGRVINDNTLIYVQAGIASGKVKISQTGDTPLANHSATRSGLTAGIGMDLLMSDQWTLGVSLNRFDLGDEDYTPSGFAAGKIGFTGNLGSVSLSRHF